MRQGAARESEAMLSAYELGLYVQAKVDLKQETATHESSPGWTWRSYSHAGGWQFGDLDCIGLGDQKKR